MPLFKLPSFGDIKQAFTTQDGLINTDKRCENLLVISSVASAVVLFEKCVLAVCNKQTIQANRYYQHIQSRSAMHCLLLCVPVVGNLTVWIYRDIIQHLSSDIVRADKNCDRYPVISTISNCADLVLKLLYSPLTPTSFERYITHIQNKSIGRCAILLIPVIGNVIVWLQDRAKEKAQIAKHIQEFTEREDYYRTLQRTFKHHIDHPEYMLSLTDGRKVPANEKMEVIWDICKAHFFCNHRFDARIRGNQLVINSYERQQKYEENLTKMRKVVYQKRLEALAAENKLPEEALNRLKKYNNAHFKQFAADALNSTLDTTKYLWETHLKQKLATLNSDHPDRLEFQMILDTWNAKVKGLLDKGEEIIRRLEAELANIPQV
jgi:hypothetical protein